MIEDVELFEEEEEDYDQKEDRRPPPKSRKYLMLWQTYLWWNELMEMRKRHNLRLSSINRGKCKMDGGYEKAVMERLDLDGEVERMRKSMVDMGKTVPVWDWITSIKGMKSGSLPTQLLSQIDDISRCPTVASLWRFAGFAVFDGKAEKNKKGATSKFNRKLKGVCFNIGDTFIKHQTPYFVDIYYAEKERQRELHPDILCQKRGCKWEDCEHKKDKEHVAIFTKKHIHYRAWRKMMKEFLKLLWIEWRIAEGICENVNHIESVIQNSRVGKYTQTVLPTIE